MHNVHKTIEPVVVILFAHSCVSCFNGSVRLMKIYQRLLLFVLYVTDEGLLKIITVQVCMSLMKVYLRLLLFLLYVTDESLLKIISVRVV